jgi:hypothetical protein
LKNPPRAAQRAALASTPAEIPDEASGLRNVEVEEFPLLRHNVPGCWMGSGVDGSRVVARLSLSLLGPLQVTLDGHPITGFRSNKVRALLAHLAVEADRTHPRELLADIYDWFTEGLDSADLREARDVLDALS